MAAPASPDERWAEDATVAAMVTAAQAAIALPIAIGRRRSATRRWMARTAVAAAVLVAGTGTAAAAGALPDTAQSAIARATAHIGLDLPDPRGTVHVVPPPTGLGGTSTGRHDAGRVDDGRVDDARVDDHDEHRAGVDDTIGRRRHRRAATDASTPLGGDDAAESPAVTTPASGPRLDGPAKHGLCTAWDAHRRSGQPEPQGTPFADLEAAAAAAGQSVADFCAPELATAPASTVDAPAETSAPGGARSTEHDPGGEPGGAAGGHPPTRPTHPTHPAKADDRTP